MEPALFSPLRGLQVATGEVSVSPYPSTSVQPVNRSKVFLTSTGRAAPPEMQYLMDERSYLSRSPLPLIAVYMVGTPGKSVGPRLCMVSSTCCTSKRGRSTISAAISTAMFIAVLMANT